MRDRIATHEWRTSVAALLLLAGACSGATSTPDASLAGPAARIELETAPVGTAGDTVVVRVRVPSGLGGVQGRLRFDPARWRYVGQPLTPHVVMVNAGEATAGRLRFAAAWNAGLPAIAADLRFVVQQRSAATPVLELEEVVDRAGVPLAATVDGPVRRVTEPALNLPVRERTAADWLAAFGNPDPPVATRPGDGAIYGDANLTGTVSIADVVILLNVSVGNLPLLTLANRDVAIAGNPAPFNLPGLGEANDPLPPGRNADGSFVISVSDAVVVQNEATQVDQPVIGERIPGRPVAPVTARVLITDSIKVNRTFSRDTIYEIRGSVVVGDPSPLGQPDVTLTIEPGTRVEFTRGQGSRLVVRVGAKLIAVGTRLEPIVFTCADPLPMPGCWGGLHINGFSLLNTAEFIGSPTKTGRGGTGVYGGFLIQDNSGALRFVRIEYAGEPTATNDTLGGLQLLGVGTGTAVDSVQVRQSLGDGVVVSGGTVRVSGLVVTDPGKDALSFDDGWTGAVQFFLARLGAGSRHAIRGSNAATDFNAGPRSSPTVSHATIVGPPPSGVLGRSALFFEQGSGGTVVNSIVWRAAAVGFDVQGEATCNVLLSNGLRLSSALVFANPAPFATDADCVDEQAYGLDPFRAIRLEDPDLLAPDAIEFPDYRPRFGSPAATGAESLPVDGFFRSGLTYLGAMPPANFQASDVPWYAGWTRGW